MSVICALKHESDIYFACDSQNTDSRAHFKSNPKWVKFNSSLVAVSGDSYARTLIETQVPFQGTSVNRENVLAYSIQLKTTIPNDLSFTTLIGGNGDLFRITNQFEVIEIEEYDAIGSGQELALGSLYSSKKYPSSGFRVEDAVRAACLYKTSCGGKIFNCVI